MSVRTICILVPTPKPPLSVVIPGMGELKTIQEFALQGYNACHEARAFLQMIAPALAGLSLPLCILRCVSSIIKVFDASSFPPINVGAIPKMISSCACLTGFTPFAFCGMLRGVINGVLRILSCIIGLMGDIVRLEAQIASLATDPNVDDGVLQCMTANAGNLRDTIAEAFGPVSDFFNSVSFLFEFVGAATGTIGSITGSSMAEVVTQLLVVENILQQTLSVLNTVCPP